MTLADVHGAMAPNVASSSSSLTSGLRLFTQLDAYKHHTTQHTHSFTPHSKTDGTLVTRHIIIIIPCGKNSTQVLSESHTSWSLCGYSAFFSRVSKDIKLIFRIYYSDSEYVQLPHKRYEKSNRDYHIIIS